MILFQLVCHIDTDHCIKKIKELTGIIYCRGNHFESTEHINIFPALITNLILIKVVFFEAIKLNGRGMHKSTHPLLIK